MNLLSRPPNRPYRNLFVAALVGVPAGYLMGSLPIVLIDLFEYASLSRTLALIASALKFSLLGYIVMVPLLLVYGLPALWLALKVRLAGPATAFAISMLPGLYIWFSYWPDSSIYMIPLAVSATTGLAFVALAYRGAEDVKMPDRAPGFREHGESKATKSNPERPR